MVVKYGGQRRCRLLQPVSNAALTFVVAMLFMVPLASIDYFPARGQEREEAVLATVALSGGRTSCGYRAFLDNTDEYVYTYRVESPADGLPPTFQVYGCPDLGLEGEVRRVARGGTGEDAEIYLDPFDTFLDVVAFSALLSGIASGAVLLWGLALAAWRGGRHAMR